MSAVPAEYRSDAKREIGQFLVEKVLDAVGGAKSPVKGEDFPALSKEYKKFKVAEGHAGKPNMELYGDMLDSLEARNTRDGIDVGFFDKEAWKADGHLKFSGKENNTPQRRFLPGEGQEFKTDIAEEIDRIIADYVAKSDITKDNFADVESTKDLYAALEEIFGDLSRTELRLAALRSDAIVELLEDMGLMELF